MKSFRHHLPSLLLSFLALATDHVTSATADCASLSSTAITFNEGINGTIISSTAITAGTNVTIGGGQGYWCQNFTVPTVDICRVIVNVTTSPRSASYIEVWLPNKNDSAWNGRFLSTGNGGLNGCVDYSRMVYTTSLGFASTGDNGGHDGNSGYGAPFLNNVDVVIDFSYRSRHSAVVVGKQLTNQFYGKSYSKSYYYGCSTGGRQGMKAAQMYPHDFDGIVAGSPATDFNHLTSWSGHFITLTGLNASDERYLNLTQWTAVHAEVLRQCDTLDGVADGILEDSSICHFNPEYILCSRNLTTGCLSNIQAQTVRYVFSAVYGLNNTFIYPRLSPGAEIAAFTGTGFGALAGGLTGPGPQWYQNAIFNNPSWNPLTFNALDIAYADSLNARNGYISSYDGNLTSFRNAGGKIVTYHGGQDPIIPGEQSPRYYRHIADTMSINSTEMDKFYRLFPISGMSHCNGGPGAWAFGQLASAANASDNILWDVVNWVEKNTPPDRLIGTKWFNDSSINGIAFQRAHCRYPYRTTYIGGGLNPNLTTSWNCTYIQDWDVCGGESSRLPKLC